MSYSPEHKHATRQKILESARRMFGARFPYLRGIPRGRIVRVWAAMRKDALGAPYPL